MRIFSGILIAVSITAAPIVWQLAERHFAPAELLPAVDIAPLAQDVAALQDEMARLRSRIDGLDARTSIGLSAAAASPEPERQNPTASDTLRDAFAQVVLIADRRSANDGLTVASPSFLRDLIGLPRNDLTDDCQPATNSTLTDLLVTENVGPIRARMVRPAISSIRQVFANVQVFEPELYDRIQSAGSLCVRLIRGSTSSASAHAYGLAVDINIDGVLDGLADGKTQLGLILLADFFKKEGWIWGAGFSREDSMHFEVSREKLLQWRRQGLI
ncbi:M15 family peptidase [Loktanella sp. D2R18]|uniref:M15 family metallopeptidase n=1 Tax=Rhodobacterales TaxID=204455 RepID=UPI000DE9DC64|nr:MULTISPECIES: M15 family metallopeptidase [Rhodobacterales]MDO6590531.1 M15 family metallopeptidase [Yoonia sp. 1_MG-2023]RBW41248.1 M15 family peptidase [Loktanella sp. D2R18]